MLKTCTVLDVAVGEENRDVQQCWSTQKFDLLRNGKLFEKRHDKHLAVCRVS